jgi:Cd2+/Zn2+-exporting ATPase
MRVTAQASDTKLARIVHLVEAAQSARAPVQRFVDRFSAWYTPAVIVGALAIAIVAPALGSIGAPWPGAEALREYVYRALVLLVVACPCALVISTPVAIVSAIGRATRDGVLVKGGVFLELASKAGAVALDKTGTLTHGRPSVQRVVALAPDFDAARVLALAAAMERHSNHPLARAVATAVPEGELPLVEALIEVPGRGVAATVGGEHFAVGSLVFAEERGCDVSASEDVARLEAEGLTVLVLMRGCEVVGLIGMADEERPDARAAVEALLSDVGRVVMLTGDNERAAARIAAQTGVAEVRSRLLPEDKTNAVLALREEAGVVVMVGDGVNDAPALAAADVGIALGAAASDTAIEAADVAVMRDELGAVPAFLALGRKTMRVVRQNVALSLGTKAAVLLLAFFGAATLWMAVFADTGIALVVIANGLRLLRTP